MCEFYAPYLDHARSFNGTTTDTSIEEVERTAWIRMNFIQRAGWLLQLEGVLQKKTFDQRRKKLFELFNYGSVEERHSHCCLFVLCRTHDDLQWFAAGETDIMKLHMGYPDWSTETRDGCKRYSEYLWEFVKQRTERLLKKKSHGRLAKISETILNGRYLARLDALRLSPHTLAELVSVLPIVYKRIASDLVSNLAVSPNDKLALFTFLNKCGRNLQQTWVDIFKCTVFQSSLSDGLLFPSYMATYCCPLIGATFAI